MEGRAQKLRAKPALLVSRGVREESGTVAWDRTAGAGSAELQGP